MHESTQRPTLRLLTGLIVLGCVGLRFATLGGLETTLWAMRKVYWEPAWWESPWMYPAEFVAGCLMATAWVRVAQLRPSTPSATYRRAVLAASVLVVLMLGANTLRHRQRFFDSASQGWDAATFPYEANTERYEERSGVGAMAHIGAAGHRITYPDDVEPNAPHNVVFIGDSMMFGLCVPDDAALPWRLREVADRLHPGQFRAINLGQPGANIHSYNRTIDYAIDHLGADALVVALHMPNDGEVIDVNAEKPILRSWPFVLAGSFLSPDAAYAIILITSKFGRSDLVIWRSMMYGLLEFDEKIRARSIPTLVFAYDVVARGGLSHQGLFAPYLRQTERILGKNPWVRWAGVVSEPETIDGEVTRIPDDGHPTATGHAWGATFLQPAFTSFLRDITTPPGAPASAPQEPTP
ncbi:MAG: hypothetical protein RLZZ383_2498 [Pseudomonadota bacterium]|jgi:hypothetical protein